MEQLVPFGLTAGDGTVLIAVASTSSGTAPVTRGLGGATGERIADQANRSLADAVEKVLPAALEVLASVGRTAIGCDEMSVSFGIGLTAGADAFIASATANANFTVSLKWVHTPAAGTVPAMKPD